MAQSTNSRSRSKNSRRAIELAPNYLPGHVRLAEILAKEGRSDEARAKYQTLAELSLARGDVARAEGFYRALLKISGDDIGDRSRLIDLLIKQNRIDDALEQYEILGDGQMRGGNFAKAAEKFAEGVRLAGRTSAVSPMAITLRHRLAEAHARQGDFKGALAAYQEIHQQSPNDERAQFHAIDLEFRLDQVGNALKDLEDLLTRYQTRSEPQKATAVLEELKNLFDICIIHYLWFRFLCFSLYFVKYFTLFLLCSSNVFEKIVFLVLGSDK